MIDCCHCHKERCAVSTDKLSGCSRVGRRGMPFGSLQRPASASSLGRPPHTIASLWAPSLPLLRLLHRRCLTPWWPQSCWPAAGAVAGYRGVASAWSPACVNQSHHGLLVRQPAGAGCARNLAHPSVFLSGRTGPYSGRAHRAHRQHKLRGTPNTCQARPQPCQQAVRLCRRRASWAGWPLCHPTSGSRHSASSS